MENQIKETHHVSEQKLTLGFIISWLLGSMAGISGIIYIFSAPIMGILFLLMALILLPPVGKYLKKKYKFSLSGGLKTILVIIILALVGYSSGNDISNNIINMNSGSLSSASQNKIITIDIVDISTKVMEQNSVWWKYAWNLKLKNNTPQDRTTMVTIKWIDSEGFVLDSHTEYSLVVPANQEKTFNDFVLIDASLAGNVDSVKAEISR